MRRNVMNKFICCLLIFCAFNTYANYSPGDTANLDFNPGISSIYSVFDIPQFYMTGIDGKHWMMVCWLGNFDDHDKSQTGSIKISTQNYTPELGAASDGTYPFYLKPGEQSIFNFYMGKLASNKEISHFTFIVSETLHELSPVRLLLKCIPHED
jgi:hypothetical protein